MVVADDVIRFIPQIYNVDKSFFLELYSRKLLEYKLNVSGVDINALYLLNGTLWLDRHSFGDKVCRFTHCKRASESTNDRNLAEDDLINSKNIEIYGNDDCKCKFVQGLLYISDTLQDFRNLDKRLMISDFIGHKDFKNSYRMFNIPLEDMNVLLSTNVLLNTQKFIFFVYIDIKNYSCHYSIANPSIYPEIQYKLTCTDIEIQEKVLLQQFLYNTSPCVFTVYIKNKELLLTDLLRLSTCNGLLFLDTEVINLDNLFIIITNSIEFNTNLDRRWCNLLFIFFWKLKLFSNELNILLISNRIYRREKIKIPDENSFRNCRLSFGFKSSQSFNFPKFESFQSLSEFIDPDSISRMSEELHLQLMTWRIVPQLNIDKITQLKVCIIGIGSLGCYIIRQMIDWGIR